jgi:uncharacterized protein (TIGR00288 family)
VGSAVRSISGGNFAVLVDCDNIPSSKINVVFDTIRSLGGKTIDRRLYGHNFASERLRGWNETAVHWSFKKVEVPHYVKGKNLNDVSLIIDAMELGNQQDVDCFAIVSSDSDYIPLAARLRDSGKSVIGFGMQGHSSKSLIKAYNSFIYLDGASVCSRKETSCEHSDKYASAAQLARGDVSLTQDPATNEVLGGRALTHPQYRAPLDAEEISLTHDLIIPTPPSSVNTSISNTL